MISLLRGCLFMPTIVRTCDGSVFLLGRRNIKYIERTSGEMQTLTIWFDLIEVYG